ncbi:MAG: tRNA 2-thiouridine(34) synthase MnmA [Bacteroidia bacterium]|nr:tRNA 2-thiouridine(34) synthase MnmA [Sphingobacteriia bacterium]
MSTKGRVLVAMSGGIDSSVAALMLHHQGYEVIGMTMKTWDYQSSGASKRETGCCSLDSIQDARDVAVQNGFPHYILDIREDFGASIIDNFVNEYLAGRTPNPCVLCNTHIKWEALLKRADMLNCHYIATGHYANIRFENGRYIISKGRDSSKDQTYVLWGLSQQCLSRTLLPLGGYLKTEIRDMARAYGFSHLAQKSESYDICFIPDNDYRTFLNHRIPGLEQQLQGGSFMYKNKFVGTHRGYPYYTVGQRKGLEIALGHPVYVTGIEPETNTVFLGDEADLKDQQMHIRDINLIKYAQLPDNFQALTKIRYKDRGTTATLHQQDTGIEVIFHQAVSAIAPGQSAVFYEGDDVVGGGFIKRNTQRLLKP